MVIWFYGMPMQEKCLMKKIKVFLDPGKSLRETEENISAASDYG